MEEKGDGGFKKKTLHLFTKPISPMQPHYPKMGRGLVRSLFILVWSTSQLYKSMIRLKRIYSF
jgi:hypothetical protein